MSISRSFNAAIFIYFPNLVHVRLEDNIYDPNDYNLTSFQNQIRKEIILTPRPLSLVTLCIYTYMLFVKQKFANRRFPYS